MQGTLWYLWLNRQGAWCEALSVGCVCLSILYVSVSIDVLCLLVDWFNLFKDGACHALWGRGEAAIYGKADHVTEIAKTAVAKNS